MLKKAKLIVNKYFSSSSSEADYSVSDDELDANINMVDEEATLTMVENPYLSTSEESVPAEKITLGSLSQNLVTVSLGDNAGKPVDHLPVPTTPLPQPPPEHSFNRIPALQHLRLCLVNSSRVSSH